jgi:2-haloacid dehalogenase
MATGSITYIRDHVKALTFDVFGTCVDWRSTAIRTLEDAAKQKLNSPEAAGLSEDVLKLAKRLSSDDWGRFAQEWRNEYKIFCLGFEPGKSVWKDVDTHHHDSLVELLQRWNLTGLYSDEEVKELSLLWHRLQPWQDSSEGLKKLGTKFVTSTLSNGNPELLKDLDANGDLGFHEFLSAANFGVYKPDPKVYLGAAESLGVRPDEIAMVACHLGDLNAARSHGMRTIYVERSLEEDWDEDEARYKNAKEWVDIWVPENSGGLVEVARRLGIA